MLGDSYVNVLTKTSGAVDIRRRDANTFLLDLADKNYMLISRELYTVIIDNVFEKINSSLGKNVIAYLVAYKKKNIFFGVSRVRSSWENRRWGWLKTTNQKR